MRFYAFISFFLLNAYLGFSQQIIYVNSITGNDTLNGLIPDLDISSGAGPKKTISSALLLAQDGDILSVESGDYQESVILDKSIQLIKTGVGAVGVLEWAFYPGADIFGSIPVDGAFKVEVVTIFPGVQLSDAVVLVNDNGDLIFSEGGVFNEVLVAKKSFSIVTSNYTLLSGIRMDANGGTLTLGGRFEISDIVQLNQFNGGFIELSAYTLTINSEASVIGGSALSYIKTSGTGFLVMKIQGEPLTFPIGTATTFAPVSLDDASTLLETVAIRVRDALNSNSFNPDLPSTVNSFVGLEWIIEESIPGENNANLRFDYTGNNELNNWASAQNRAVYRNDGTTWTAGANSSVDGSFSSADFTALGGVFSIYSDFPNAIETASSIGSLILYPNPASANVFIRTDSADDLNYEIISIDGKVVSTGVGKSNNGIDISNLSNGVYVMRVLRDEDVAVLRFVKN